MLGAGYLLVRLLERDDGVRAAGHRRAGHDADSGAGSYRAFVEVACRQLARDLEPDGVRLTGVRRVGGAHGVAVHRRVIERRDVEAGDSVLGQHLAQGVRQRLPLGLQPADECEDALQRLLHTDHLLVDDVSPPNMRP